MCSSQRSVLTWQRNGRRNNVNMGIVHCEGRRQNQPVHHGTSGSRTTDRANMRSRDRSHIRSVDRGPWSHYKPEAEAFDRLHDALAKEEKRCSQRSSDTASAGRSCYAAGKLLSLTSYQSRGNAPSGPLLRRNTEPPNMLPDEAMAANSQPTLAMRQEFVAQAERRSTASIYILCRVLMEVIGQSSLACITPDMEDKLEAIIFGQLKIADADQLSESPLKLANWFLFSQLLGVMSEINFESVTDRFIADIEKSQKDLIIKGPPNRETEGRMELVLGGMKHLRIKIYPDDVWDQSCDFMISLGRFFARSHGHRLKYAYCQALEILLLPIAAKANTELNVPKWTEVLATIGPRLASMMIKPRHWPVAFPLTATLLCVSPADTFATQWLQLVLPLQPKFKDRFSRPICLQVISRLLWTYLYRTTDTLNTTIKKLEEVMKLVLPPGRRSYVSTVGRSLSYLYIFSLLYLVGYLPSFWLAFFQTVTLS